MVHSIEFTKIWTNIYSKTHPQRKHFSSKQVTYWWMTESIRTNISKTYSLCGGRERRKTGEGREKEKKKQKPPTLQKQRICSMKTKALREKWANTHVDYCKASWGGAGVLGKMGAQSLPLVKAGQALTQPPCWARGGTARAEVGPPWIPHIPHFSVMEAEGRMEAAPWGLHK